MSSNNKAPKLPSVRQFEAERDFPDGVDAYEAGYLAGFWDGRADLAETAKHLTGIPGHVADAIRRDAYPRSR